VNVPRVGSGSSRRKHHLGNRAELADEPNAEGGKGRGQRRHHAGGIADARTICAVEIGKLVRLDLGDPPPRTFNVIQLGRHSTDRALRLPIRSLDVWGTNPAVTTAVQARVLEGLARVDLFTVVHEQFARG